MKMSVNQCTKMAAAVLIATLGSVANAATSISTNPVQTSVRGVPPNIMLLLDNSGSMAWQYMYNPSISVLKNGSQNFSSPYGDNSSRDSRSSYYYANSGSPYGANDSNNYAAISIYDLNPITNTIYYDPRIDYKPWVKDGVSYTGGTTLASVYTSNDDATSATNMRGLYFYYYMPKTEGMTLTQLSDVKNYYRYRVITTSAGVSEVDRCEFGTSKWSANCVVSTGGNNSYTHPRLNGTRRTAVEEANNFATWYSYYRTRMKVAKAGVGQAFSALGQTGYRVGFYTINYRANNRFNIPVTSNDGVFTGANRTNWFNKVFSATSSGGTGLRSALKEVGDYYKTTADTGPWGPLVTDPEDGARKQVSCRQNFVIATTDGYWNPSADYALYNSGITNETVSVGNIDNTNGPIITSADNSTSYQYKPVTPYKDGNSDSLADISMKYWREDLRTDLANNVAVSADDPAFWQHMVTFSVSIGLRGTLDPVLDLPRLRLGAAGGGIDWPSTAQEDARRIDDLWHAALNGRGQFVAASSPQKFQDALTNSLNAVSQRMGSGSNVAANTAQISSDSAVYQASYQSGIWSGELIAYQAGQDGVLNQDLNSDGERDFLWKASKQVPAPLARNVIYNVSGTVRKLTPSNPPSGLGSTIGNVVYSDADIAAYLLGDRSKERINQGQLRDRPAGVIGDIVDSSPAYDDSKKVIYVGANDGMLHAFSSANGTELFSYIPRGVVLTASGLGQLANPDYIHTWTVDGQFSTSTIGADTYVVGGLGRGGKGLFALKVTNPSSFTVNDVAWDSTGSGALDSWGLMLGMPKFGMVRGGTGNTLQSAVIVGNGVNSTTGNGSLVVLNTQTGAVIREIPVPGADNGLIEVELQYNSTNSSQVDYVYAGDMQGNLWKFDLTNPVVAGWEIAYGTPLYKAGSGHPIMGGIRLAKDPSTNKNWVFFGTGRLLDTPDLTDTTLQSMYGIIDDGTAVSQTAAGDTASLAARSFAADPVVLNGHTVRSFQEHINSLETGKRGWFVALNNPASGERVLTGSTYQNGILFFNSVIPPKGNTCEPGGRGFSNGIDAFTGTATNWPLFDVNGDGIFDDQDTIEVNGKRISVGSIDLNIGMPTQGVLMSNGSSSSNNGSGSGNGSGSSQSTQTGILVSGGSTSGMGDIKVNLGGGGGNGQSGCTTNCGNTGDPGNNGNNNRLGRLAWKEVVRQ